MTSPISPRDLLNILGWICSGVAGESDRRVGLHLIGKITHNMNPKLKCNPKLRIDCVVRAKLPKS